MRLSWSDHDSVPTGHRLTMEETFEIVARDSFYKMIFPDWLGIAIPPLKRANLAFNELRVRCTSTNYIHWLMMGYRPI